VVGLVRALGPALQPDHVRVNAVCPGFVDTPLLAGARAHFTTSGFPLLQPAEVAAALLTVAAGDTTGEAFVVQPGLAPTAYRFRGVPGPRVPGAEGATPPAGLA
jgi:NAD(P)-dependent dehydrogenase (short-subunit alcohol dehydrogenase family)